MDKELYHLTRGELGRMVYGKKPNFRTIQDPIQKLMKKIDGAELVREDRGYKIGDEYHVVYYISPEATVVRFDAEGDVRITGIGTDNASLDETKIKFNKLLSLEGI